MVKWTVLFKPLRIFLELVSLILREIGTSICLWWSLLKTIATIHLYLWLPMKPFMVGDVGLRLDDFKWVSVHFWFPIRFMRLWRLYHKEPVANSL